MNLCSFDRVDSLMGEYAAVLDGLKKLEGIRALFVLNQDGEIVEKQGKLEGMSLEKLTNLVLECFGSGEKAGALLRSGEMEQQYLEFEEFNITVEGLSPMHILTAVASTGTNLGRIRYEFKKSKKLFEEITKGEEKGN